MPPSGGWPNASSRLRSDGQHPRILVRATDFETYARLAFDLPRINAKGNHTVCRWLLRALAGNAVCPPDRRPVLAEQVRLLVDYANQTLATDYEKKTVQERMN